MSTIVALIKKLILYLLPREWVLKWTNDRASDTTLSD
jgi:hypothetical protein